MWLAGNDCCGAMYCGGGICPSKDPRRSARTIKGGHGSGCVQPLQYAGFVPRYARTIDADDQARVQRHDKNTVNTLARSRPRPRRLAAPDHVTSRLGGKPEYVFHSKGWVLLRE